MRVLNVVSFAKLLYDELKNFVVRGVTRVAIQEKINNESTMVYEYVKFESMR